MPFESLEVILYRLDELKEDFNLLREEIRTGLKDHEIRIRQLEQNTIKKSERNGNGKFWASIIALATAMVSLAMAFLRSG